MSSKIGVNKDFLARSGFEARLFCAAAPPQTPLLKLRFWAEKFSAEICSVEQNFGRTNFGGKIYRIGPDQKRSQDGR